jgi:hypothetical protein
MTSTRWRPRTSSRALGHGIWCPQALFGGRRAGPTKQPPTVSAMRRKAHHVLAAIGRDVRPAYSGSCRPGWSGQPRQPRQPRQAGQAGQVSLVSSTIRSVADDYGLVVGPPLGEAASPPHHSLPPSPVESRPGQAPLNGGGDSGTARTQYSQQPSPNTAQAPTASPRTVKRGRMIGGVRGERSVGRLERSPVAPLSRRWASG